MPDPLDVRRPFTRTEALEAGITDAQLRGPRFQRVFPSIYVSSHVPLLPRVRTEAALRLHPPTAFASHASAARLLDLPVPGLPLEEVTVPRAEERRRAPGLRSHVAQDQRGVAVLDGLRASSPARTFVELAGSHGLVELVVAGDHMVRTGMLTPTQLTGRCAATGLAGAVRARRAAAYVRAGVDSPMESRLRMLLVLAGLPEPAINLVARDTDGTPLRRYDCSYPGAKVAVEYDGRQHVERIEQWERDLQRREAMEDDSWRLLVVVSRDIYVHPERTLERVHRLLRARGLAGVPRRLSEAWRPHFPSR